MSVGLIGSTVSINATVSSDTLFCYLITYFGRVSSSKNPSLVMPYWLPGMSAGIRG